MKKRALILTMALCLMLPLIVPAEAAAPSPQELCPALSDADIEHVELIFDLDRAVQIVNTSGNDVRQSFIEENRDAYNNNEYMVILDNIAKNSLAIVEEPAITPFALTSEAKGVVTVYFDTISGQQTKEWLKAELTGKYQVIDYNNTISAGILPVEYKMIEKSSTTMRMSFIVTNNSYAISSDRKKITFSVKYYADIGFIDGIPSGQKTGSATFSGRVG